MNDKLEFPPGQRRVLAGLVTRAELPYEMWEDTPVLMTYVLKHMERTCRLYDVEPIGEFTIRPMTFAFTDGDGGAADSRVAGYRWELVLDPPARPNPEAFNDEGCTPGGWANSPT